MDYSDLSNVLPGAVKGEYFARRTEKWKILDKLLAKEVENLEDHRSPKVQYLVDEEDWICSSDQIRHKTTLHFAKSKAKLFGNWIKRPLML